MQGPRKATINKGTVTNCFQVFRQYEFASEFALKKSTFINICNSIREI